MVLALSVARRNASEAPATGDFGGLGLYWTNYIKTSVAVDDHRVTFNRIHHTGQDHNQTLTTAKLGLSSAWLGTTPEDSGL
jgi:hypothetical protein